MNNQLATYRSKRDFTRTAEPRGDSAVTPSSQPRFVIQKHAARRLHYDLRLELDGVFKSWAVTRGPSLDPRDKRLAVEVEDHPLEYGDFEGTIPAGQYGGGTVQLWDRGYWTSENKSSPQDALSAGDFKFHLDGRRLHGSWVLVRMKHDRTRSKRTNWLLIKHRDADAQTADAGALLAQDASVASGRSMAMIAAGKGRRPRPFMTSTGPAADAVWNSKSDALQDPSPVPFTPTLLPLQLARVSAIPPSGDEWIHEIKFDGYRVQLHVRSGRAVILTRSGLDWTGKFRSLARDAGILPDAVIDGEIVALDERGASSFSLLQAALASGKESDLTLFAFDLLAREGRDLRAEALVDRKEKLKRLLERTKLTGPDSLIRYVDHIGGDGRRVLASACAMGLEGIVSKLAGQPYRAGRAGGWTKTKCRPGQEVVIGGWSEESGRLRSLLVGTYQDGELRYAGRVGTGFGQDIAAMLLSRLKAIAAPLSPFAKTGAPAKDRSVHWARPDLVAEIQFAGFTEGGIVRQAAFKGLREDKPASEVVRETAFVNDSKPPPRSRKPAVNPSPADPKRDPLIMGTTISHPDKALWDDDGAGHPITKLDLANYYQEVASWILAHIKGRPCSIIRAPDGIDGEHFFQRHAMAGASKFFDLRRLPGEPKPYLEINLVEAFPALAQVAAVELHPWNCMPENPEVPGRFVFDLDPAPDVPFKEVVAAALEMRDRLQHLGLVSFCKTTGGKGLHIVTPLTQNLRKPILWPEAKEFARQFCARMAADTPSKYLITMSKAARTGKIYLDYLRNDRIATAVAPLSPRARPGAPVSMPLRWSQVRSSLIPSRFTLRSAARALTKSKPWTDYDRSASPLADALARLSS